MSSPERELSVMYCCTRKTSQIIQKSFAYVRIKDGTYQINFINPSNIKLISSMEFKSAGLQNEYEILLPSFQDDLLIEIKAKVRKDKTLIDGTK